MTAIDSLAAELNYARQAGDKLLELDVLRRLSAACGDAGQRMDAFNYESMALDLARAVGARQAEVEIMSNIALAYAGSGQMHQAIAIFEAAIALARDNNLRRHAVIMQLNLALVYSDIDLNKGHRLLEQALVEGQRVEDLPDMAHITILDKLASTEIRMGLDDKAKEHMQKALATCQFVGDKYLEGELLRSWGDAYCTKQQYAQAEPYLRQSILVFQDVKAYMNMACALGVLGDTYLRSGKKEAAIKSFELARQWFVSLNAPEYIQHCDQLLAELRP